MAADETPLWNRLVATAREADADVVGWDQRSAGPPRPAMEPPPIDGGPALALRAGPTLLLVLREVRATNTERRRVRWLWRVEWLALAASLLAALSIDWRTVLPSDGCPLLAAQIVSEEFLP